MRTPGFYWVRFRKDDDWEPASWNGLHWMMLGTDEFGEPAEIGPRIPEFLGTANVD